MTTSHVHMPASPSQKHFSHRHGQARPQLEEGKGKEPDGSTCTWQRAQYADGARGLGPGTVIYAGTAWNGNHDS